jgi:nucleoporin SEH1
VRIWRVEAPDEDSGRESWTGEVVGEFGKGGARVGMVDVSDEVANRNVV